jgi:hypothetical protein
VFRIRIRIRIHLVAWIRIRIPNADPDPGGLKRAKMKKKNAAKRQKIRHRTYKNHYNWYGTGIKMFIVTLFSLKFNIIFYFDKIFVFNIYPGSGSRATWIRIHFQSWFRIRIHLKSWIRISTKSIRIRNTAANRIGVPIYTVDGTCLHWCTGTACPRCGC